MTAAHRYLPVKLSEPPTASAPATRAPANGLKLMLLIAIVLALAVAYGQWQRAQRSSVIHAQIAPLASSTPSPAPDKE